VNFSHIHYVVLHANLIGITAFAPSQHSL